MNPDIITWIALGVTWACLGIQVLYNKVLKSTLYYRGRLDEQIAMTRATDGADFQLIVHDQIAMALGDKEAQRWLEARAQTQRG